MTPVLKALHWLSVVFRAQIQGVGYYLTKPYTVWGQGVLRTAIHYNHYDHPERAFCASHQLVRTRERAFSMILPWLPSCKGFRKGLKTKLVYAGLLILRLALFLSSAVLIGIVPSFKVCLVSDLSSLLHYK